jgi:hypothetical protein
MKSSILTFFLSFILGTNLANGVTNVVLPSNAQAAINAAQDGDSIGLLPGAVGTLTINNKEIILKAQGDTPPVISKIESNGSNLTLIGLNVAEVNATDSGTPSKLVVHGGKFGRITSSVSDAQISYAKANYLSLSNRAVVTACELDGSTQHFQNVSLGFEIGIDIHGNNTQATIRNSRIWNYNANDNSSPTEKFIGIRLRDNSSSTLHNNLVYDCYDSAGHGTETNCGMGIFVKTPAVANIVGNALWACYVRDGDTGAGNRLIGSTGSAYVRNNFFWKKPSARITSNFVSSGLLTDNLTESNESAVVFQNLAADNFQPSSASRLINAGPEGTEYNDRDGSRNDIGMFGGHDYIPNGRNSTKPVVISLELPIAVPRNGTATIKSTGATFK